MPSPESFSFGSGAEYAGEEARSSYELRGEKTLEAIKGKEEELKKRKLELLAREKELEREINQLLGISDSAESAETPKSDYEKSTFGRMEAAKKAELDRMTDKLEKSNLSEEHRENLEGRLTQQFDKEAEVLRQGYEENKDVVGPKEEQDAYEDWLKKHEAENQENIERYPKRIIIDMDAPETPDTPDTPEKTPDNPEDAKFEEFKKKRSRGFVNFIRGVALTAVVALIGTGLFSAFVGQKNSNKSNQTPQPTSSINVSNIPGDSSSVLDALEFIDVEGIKDGYGEKGLWLSEHKDHDYDYGDAHEVSEVCDGDEVEMLKYAADNQVESLADYMERLPKELCPEGFYGLNPRQIERKLENLSPEEFDKVKEQALQALDQAFTRTAVTERDYHHYGMELRDKNGNVIHENMKLTDHGVKAGTPVVEFYWVDEDGKEIGSMMVNIHRVYDADDNIVGHAGGLEVLRVGTTEETPPEDPEQPETPPAKNEDEEIAHAGNPGKLELDEEVTPSTSLEQDQANFEEIERQKQEDAKKAKEAEAARKAQEEAERRAAEEAEARRQAEAEAAARQAEEERAAEAERQRQADEAARKAQEEAAEAQRQAEEAERQRQAEEAARQAAQEEADRKAAEEAAAAAAAASATAEDRADAFNNGDF